MFFFRLTNNSVKNSLTVYIKFVHVRRKSYTSTDYCINLVRTMDNENYFCSLLLPEEMRTTAFAVRAFNVEIASVQDQVSNTNLGQMRMKFWEESIEKIYKGKVPNNPVAVELSKAVKKHKLSKPLLQKLVSCRAKRLGQPSFLTTREMEDYAEDSCSTVLLLILQAASVKSIACEHVAIHVGKAQGLINLLRGIPHCISSRVLSLPSDLLAQHDVSEESVFRGTYPEGMTDVVYDIAERARLHLLKARENMDDIPLDLRCIFLSAIITERYLKRLRLAYFNVFDGGLQKKTPLLPLILYWNSIVKRF